MQPEGRDDDPDDGPSAPRWSWPTAALAILFASLLGWLAIVSLLRWALR